METSRIFIGGLPPGTTNDELIQRFKSFGDVKSCEVVPDKEYPGGLPGSDPMVFTRNFGYIAIEPKDEKSLQRAIAVYNGSKWRGCTLKCKLAKPTAMEQLEKEWKEEEEKTNEPVDYTLPVAKDGITLRIRQPFNRQLVPVMLGGSKLKLEKLGETTASAEPQQPPSTSLENNTTIVSTPLKPRKSFEQHLRECAEKYAASEEGQRAAAARQERLENTKAAAAQDQEAAVNMSMNKDAAVLTAAASGNKRVQKQTQGPLGLSKVLPAKRHHIGVGAFDEDFAQAPPAQRSRIVDFLSDEDFTAINQQQNTNIDLSRFDSDTEEEEKNEMDGQLKKSGGKSTIIPQVDGAADSDTTTTDTDSSSDSDDISESDDENSSSSSSSSESESESESEDEEESSDDDGAGAVKTAEEKKEDTSSDTDDSSDDSSSSDDEEEENVEEEPTVVNGGGGNNVLNKEAEWMAKYLPAGASFFRQDPLMQVEGAWRAGREAAVREYKERRRQAMRQAGKRGGGGTSGGGGGKRRTE